MVVGQPTAGATTLPQLNYTGSPRRRGDLGMGGAIRRTDGGNINFTVSSSIIGLKRLLQPDGQLSDATDISYATRQSDCSPKQVPYPYQYIPDVGGSLAFEYNLKGSNGVPITNLVLNAPTLLGIFTGAIRNWHNPAIQALNPSTPLPHQRITAFYRSDPSGENYLLSDYFSECRPRPAHRPSNRRRASPPRRARRRRRGLSFSNGVPPNLDTLVAEGRCRRRHTGGGAEPGRHRVRRDRAYAKDVGLPVVSVVNAAGAAVQPTAQSTAEALQRGDLQLPLDGEPRRRLRQHDRRCLSIVRVQLFRSSVRSETGGEAGLLVRWQRQGHHEQRTRSGTRPVHYLHPVLGPGQHGKARVHPAAPHVGRGRFSGRRATPRRHDAATANPNELPQPNHYGFVYEVSTTHSGPSLAPTQGRETKLS